MSRPFRSQILKLVLIGACSYFLSSFVQEYPRSISQYKLSVGLLAMKWRWQRLPAAVTSMLTDTNQSAGRLPSKAKIELNLESIDDAGNYDSSRLSETNTDAIGTIGEHSSFTTAKSSELDDCSQPGVKRGSMCACKHRIDVQFLHIPKGGGSSIACTFQPLKRNKPPSCQSTPAAHSAATSFQGVNHETYDFYMKSMQCKGGMYQPRGANCAPVESSDSCRPFITFVAHPVARFLSAFYQNYNAAKYSKLESKPFCNFLRCRPGSPLAALYKVGKSSLTPSAFALWREEDVEYGFNLQTLMLGGSDEHRVSHQSNDAVDNLTARAHKRSPIFPTEPLRDNIKGRAVLARAKARLDSMDFVGLTERFTDSVALMSWQVGIPLESFCSCNLNPFKPLNLTVEAAAEIEARNSLDMDLYRHASILFEKRFTEFEESVRAAPFICNKDDMVCRSPLNGGAYIPQSMHRSLNGKIIRSGKHSVCSYECRREQRVPLIPPPPLST